MDGSVYMSDHLGTLYSLDQEGAIKWISDWYTRYYTRMCIDQEGTLYANTFNGFLTAFNPDGSLLWRADSNEMYNGPIALAADGKLYVGRRWPNARLTALDLQGKELWTYDCEADFVSVGPSQTIYTSNYSNLIALDPSGNLKWTFAAGHETGRLSIARDETLYLSTYSNRMLAIDPD